ncbi:hypothetical protein PK98_11930 [Croceibacterium mercuriale]|uniref:Uncharacterized protein n=1 Tax=Croceibacterium mercuriale TaxID=1572751 RepID=A0A0B2BTA9_9SPHN|nr:hypothetical protein [Croceibacterium mercuriale]KHL24664.1 hypothetical protein PK98_11930 [Croceibacterium mercuriale]
MTTGPAPVRDADWLVHRYDAVADAFHYIPADRDLRSRAVFLTDAELGAAARAPVAVTRDLAVAGVGAAGAPLRLIVHSAFCCSTLLARAFDLPGTAHALKEPQVLNDLAGWRRRGGAPRDVAARLDDALRLLAAPVPTGEALLVKPSNVVNALVLAMLSLRPDARAVLLYAPLPTFLASVASKGLEGRLWVRELWTKLAADGLCDLAVEPADPLRHTDLQIAALGWLAQHRLFGRIAARFGDSVRTLDSAALLARPADALAATGDLFGLRVDAAAIAAGPAFARNAKTGAAFGAGDRSAVHDAARAAHGPEIALVAQWAEAVADANGIAMDLPQPLV